MIPTPTTIRQGIPCALALLALSSGSALAQPGTGFAIGVFFDEAGTQSTLEVAMGIPFEVHVVVGGDEAIDGWEMGLDLAPEIDLISVDAINPSTSSSPVDPSGGNFIFVMGQCVVVSGTYWVARLTCQLNTAGEDLLLCAGPGFPSSSFAGRPVYQTCTGAVQDFDFLQNGQGIYRDGCAVVNATQMGPIATGRSSWGTLKTRW